MKALPLIVPLLCFASCSHPTGKEIGPPTGGETAASIDRSRLVEIDHYQKADPTDFIADCVRTKEWKFLSCTISIGHVTSFPGLTQSDIQRYIASGLVGYECIDNVSEIEGLFGESADLRDKLRDARITYATRVNQAVLAELEKAGGPSKIPRSRPPIRLIPLD